MKNFKMAIKFSNTFVIFLQISLAFYTILFVYYICSFITIINLTRFKFISICATRSQSVDTHA